MATAEYRVPAVEHAIRLLRFLKERNHRPWGVSELSRGVGVNKSTCFAILRTLERHGLVAHDETTRKYSLGTGLIELGGAVASAASGAVVAKPFLLDLFEELRLTSLLGRRVQDKVVIIDKAEVLDDLRVTVPLGQVLSLASGAMGRSLLSRLRDSEVERILRAEPGRDQRGRKGAVLARVRRDLEEVRRQGYAESLGEIQAGINSVAAPIFDHHGHAVLTIGVIGLGSALHPRNLPRCGRKVREAASLITRAIGGVAPT
ncbi:MAG: IclR family transcriptional regulator [Candidatus Methylomirabilaceae bacterium]